MLDQQPRSARVEIASNNQLKRNQLVRSASQRAPRPTAPICCVDCKIPLLTDIETRETSNKSRAESAVPNNQLCRECTLEKTKNLRSPSSRLVKSASVNWSQMGDNIENWFEKAKTPDQRVVYNFLQQINNKSAEKPVEKEAAKDLDDVLNNLKKYQTRFHSARPRNKLTRLFESSSWRVMRQPMRGAHISESSLPAEDPYHGSIFASTDRRMRSTFLIHPNWI